MKIAHYTEGLSLSAYLAIEQDLLAHVEEATLFTWIAPPTVIYGKHQEEQAEVNIAYCDAHNISIVQRKSGGGCVYADGGNLMLSYITPSTHSERVFANFIQMVANALQAKGISAVTTAHNDILIEGKKVSGSACFTSPKGTIVHSTLLYDVNIDAMYHALTPSSSKLAKHGVSSVRQRVVNIKEITKEFADIHELRLYIEKYGNLTASAIDA